jgi:hypothetical protein
VPRKVAGLTDAEGSDFDAKNYVPSFPFGDFLSYMTHPWETLERFVTPKGMRLYWQLSDPMLNVSDPEIAKEVLSRRDSEWKRDISSLYILSRLLGNGIVAADGGRNIYNCHILTVL